MPLGLRGFQKGNKLGKKFTNQNKLKNVVCYKCGSGFQRHESTLKRSKHNFCSYSCAMKTYIPHLSMRKRIIKKCTICENEFEVIKFRKKAKYCSNECRGKSMLNLLRTSWQRFYQSNQWQKLRKEVYKRDNYTCKKCRKSHVLIVAHHLDEIRRSPKSSWMNITRIITLCVTCHNIVHNKFKTRIMGSY